jgi:hypothetical protein
LTELTDVKEGLLVLGTNDSIKDNPEFQSAVIQSGFRLVSTIDEMPTLVLCFDWHPRVRRILVKAKRKGIKRALIVQEPKIVLPKNWSSGVRRKFSTVIEVGNPKATTVVNWPQSWPQSLPEIATIDATRRTDCAVMIQARKFSFVSGQLYSLRTELVSTDTRVKVFGPGWDQKCFRVWLRLIAEFKYAVSAGAPMDFTTLRTAFVKPLNWEGAVEDKISAMTEFRVAIIIENSLGYTSEKIFDAFFAGCIPVYVGPALDVFEIPTDLYVKSAAEANSISEGISIALEMDYDNWLTSVRGYLASKQTRDLWSSSSVLQRLIQLARKA